MPRDQVFISYSHKDKKWRDDLDMQLKPYLREGSIISWSDKEIKPGSKWFGEIKTALTDAKVAILLVTPEFLASDFIDVEELGALLKQRIKILWVPVRASSYKKTALKDYQAVLDPNKPLANMKVAERAQAWVTICEKIEEAVNPRRKLERDVKHVQERQEHQAQEISGIKIALKGILTKHELGPLQGLNGDGPVNMKYEPDLYRYLHRLDGLNFIQPNPGYGLMSIENQHKNEERIDYKDRPLFDLKQYVYITADGRSYLKTLSDLGAI
jgi:hypothetical protein